MYIGYKHIFFSIPCSMNRQKSKISQADTFA